jgi:hypothetical protein
MQIHANQRTKTLVASLRASAPSFLCGELKLMFSPRRRKDRKGFAEKYNPLICNSFFSLKHFEINIRPVGKTETMVN